MSKAHWALVLLIACSLLASQPVAAAALSSVLLDPEGDAYIAGNLERPGEPFQDIVRAEIGLKDGRFEFRMDVASAIPADPELPPGTVLFEWAWFVSTDHSTVPAGYPFAPGYPEQAEFQLIVIWDGVRFSLTVVDRRPLLSGQEAILTELPIAIRGTELRASVDARVLGDPSRFCWIAITWDWPTDLGTASFLGVDIAFEGRWPPSEVSCPRSA